MKYNILILMACLPVWLCAQGTRSVVYNLAQPDSLYRTSSVVTEKGMAKTLVDKLDHPAVNQTIKGHRVCIFMEKNQAARANAFGAEAVFKQLYPDVPTYVIYDKTSYWKVLVGNCLTVDEVTMLKAKAERLFPSKPFVVQDDIQISELGKRGLKIATPSDLSIPRDAATGAPVE